MILFLDKIFDDKNFFTSKKSFLDVKKKVTQNYCKVMMTIIIFLNNHFDENKPLNY